MKTILLISFLLICNYTIQSQELLIGDSTVVKTIKERASKIYNNKDQTYFVLTKKKLRHLKTYGTNIVAHSKNDTINRIISVSTTKKGQLSTEWYFSKNKLIYTYESFEYFMEETNTNSWKNFKNLSAWESRYYFINDTLKYQKHKGLQNSKQKSNMILKDAVRCRDFIMKQLHKKI